MKTFLTIGLGLTAMIAALSVATAQDLAPDTTGDATTTDDRADRPRIDANGDGTIDAAEREAMEAAIRERIAERVAEADTDGSGGISEEEARAMMEARREARGDQDGAERRGLRGRLAERLRQRRQNRGGEGETTREDRPSMFERLDTDGNGEITAAELTERILGRIAQRVERLDTNGDGAISPDEREAARNNLRERLQERRESPRGSRR